MVTDADIAVRFKFGDSEALCARLTALVVSGHKTASCDSMWAYKDRGEPIPEVGQLEMALNWDGSQAALLEVTSIELRKFCDVDEPLALLEGENDSLQGWQDDHRAYFQRNGGFSEDMMLVCEQFRLVQSYGTD